MSMKKKKVWILILSIVVVLGIGGTVAYSFTKSKTKTASGESEMPGITVQKASEQELAQSILVTGKIVPESEQKIFIEPEKGTIKEIKVSENQAVKAGDALLVYDSAKIESELARAVRSKDLLASRAKTEQNQIVDVTKRINEAKKKLQAQDSTSETTEEAPVTQESVNQLSSEKIQLEMQYESTKSEVSTTEDQIKELTAQKNNMTVVSKMDGIVVKVEPNVAKTEAGSAEPVIHIISSQPYKVIGTMSEFDAVKIKDGQPVIIRPKVYKDREWMGKIESVSQFPTEDGASGGEFGGPPGGNVTMYPFKVVITDDTSELRQGFHVSLEIKVGGGEKPLVVPHPALVDEGDIKIVYVLTDNKLERREVKTGAMNDEFIEIAEGVKLGELVVITPNEQLHDGMEVTSYDEAK
jgi:HlyD family secretion protein